MEYSKIVSVSGLPGLYELISSKTDGAVVRSLEDKSTKFASSRIHNFSHLETIEVYTVRDNVNLVDIFHAMDKASTPAPDTKDNANVKKYFETVYADIDFDRVYNSDLKKIIKWYEVLKKNNVEIKLSEPEEEEAAESNVEEELEPVKEEPGRKEARKTGKPGDGKNKSKTEEKTAKKPASARTGKSAKKTPKKKGK